MTNNYFVSDIHLSEEEPRVVECFINFCQIMAEQQAYLYIMGDLFDAWLGDDMMGGWSKGGKEQEAKVLRAINNINHSGGKTFFQMGNRDFLVAEDFWVATGCELLDDRSIKTIAGKKVLLDHGDTLCIEDIGYQQMRKMARTEEWKKQFLAKSPAERLQLKKEYFSASKSHIDSSSEDQLAVPTEYTEQLFVQHDLDIIIYGHLHKPSYEELIIQNKPRQSICLGDWGNLDSIWFARTDISDFGLYRITIDNFLSKPAEGILDTAIWVS